MIEIRNSSELTIYKALETVLNLVHKAKEYGLEKTTLELGYRMRITVQGKEEDDPRIDVFISTKSGTEDETALVEIVLVQAKYNEKTKELAKYIMSLFST